MCCVVSQIKLHHSPYLMKALTSFPSKLIVQNLGSSSPRIPVHVSDRHELCFTFYSRNYNKAPNFCLLNQLQNKGIHPILAVPSENQVNFFLHLLSLFVFVGFYCSYFFLNYFNASILHLMCVTMHRSITCYLPNHVTVILVGLFYFE